MEMFGIKIPFPILNQAYRSTEVYIQLHNICLLQISHGIYEFLETRVSPQIVRFSGIYRKWILKIMDRDVKHAVETLLRKCLVK